ncbi:MAG TPA: class I SAM-dependent methyltransferase [Candidatus Nanopelagicaceae bacterium]|nr:class I SAM-dependent methyltransferase [Candidatus Nanopelagicaceae bacterium]
MDDSQPDAPTYDRLGLGYARYRQVEPTWMEAVRKALGQAHTVVNVGAGSGSYEPSDRAVTAIEPSLVMIKQRPQSAAPVVCAVAEALPFRSNSFDASLAVFTVHHWTDADAGLAEMRRVASRQVVLTWDPVVSAKAFWFARDYLPEVYERERHLATLEKVVVGLGSNVKVVPLPVPADCADGVLAAYWRRPQAYLDPAVRAAVSTLSLLPTPVVDSAVKRLENDLDDGAWSKRYQNLSNLDSLDLGYRLVISG